ncbi:MAG: hypothetical protein [Olavius algarvensis Gamma 3 endosymbiont]|nr:MAG: hypothetical protein [Olavius algarvensis Gamma 3 endosymbiont]
MIHLAAKPVLLEDAPEVPLNAILIEAATMIGIAGILAHIFA